MRIWDSTAYAHTAEIKHKNPVSTTHFIVLSGHSMDFKLYVQMKWC